MKLNIQLFAVTKRTTFSESDLNPSNNTSTLSITVYFSANNNVTYFSSKTLRITCNGVDQSASVKLVKGGSVTKTFVFENIPHNTDGSKTVSWDWSIATGTSVIGTLTDSGTYQLTTLHTPPSDIAYTITEANPILINAGVSNDTFVENLSIKNFNITGNLYDGATISRYRIYNRAIIYGSDTLPITLDLSQITINKWLETGNIPIVAGIIDSLNGLGLSSTASNPDLYNCIPYIKPSLTDTSCTARRDGQTSGKVKLNIEGVFYNGNIGNVANAIQVSYKFWEKGTTEPSVYIPISSSSISITNNGYKITDLQIGTTDESQINWFNPQKAYNIQIKTIDSMQQETILINPLSITVGEALWSEYRDRVDFKNITKQGNIIYSGTELYSSTSGTNGAFTLNDSAENYEMLEFFFRNDVNQYGSTRIYNPNGKRINFSIVVYNTTTAKCYIQSSAKNINGTSITNYSSSEYAVGGSLTTGNYIYIYKVIGYK